MDFVDLWRCGRIRCFHLNRIASCKTYSLQWFRVLGALFSTFECFVFEILGSSFSIQGASFSIQGASFSSFGCFVFAFWVLRASVFVFECFVFETTVQIVPLYNWYKHLVTAFSRLKYPIHLVNSTIKSFVDSKVCDQQQPLSPVVLPLKTKSQQIFMYVW